MRRITRLGVAFVSACMLVTLGALEVEATATPASNAVVIAPSAWRWPSNAFRLERRFVAPPHPFGAGHRGVDLRTFSDTVIRAPADGVVAFVGRVVDRDVITLEHAGGLVSSFEPVASALTPGTRVGAGDAIGELAAGGHTDAGTYHFGVRLNGEYINPLLLLGGVPRAVLLPCCD